MDFDVLLMELIEEVAVVMVANRKIKHSSPIYLLRDRAGRNNFRDEPLGIRELLPLNLSKHHIFFVHNDTAHKSFTSQATTPIYAGISPESQRSDCGGMGLHFPP